MRPPVGNRVAELPHGTVTFADGRLVEAGWNADIVSAIADEDTGKRFAETIVALVKAALEDSACSPSFIAWRALEPDIPRGEPTSEGQHDLRRSSWHPCCVEFRVSHMELLGGPFDGLKWGPPIHVHLSPDQWSDPVPGVRVRIKATPLGILIRSED